MSIRARGQGEVAGKCVGIRFYRSASNGLGFGTLPEMKPPVARVRIATRESRLAMVQTEMVSAALRSRHPELEVPIVGMTTRGDRVLDRPLAQVGGKGLFVKELEAAMLEDRADIAVHSMKDVPMELPQEFTLVTFGERELAEDAFVSNR